ncbi:MAG TPA: glycosyltransferase family 9 protein [bacterium]|nr:glycosyltransferase family 9 protein [bacterium]
MPERILLTQLRRIGDVMMTTPAVAAVRAAFPKAEITYLTESPSDHIFRHSPHVDNVMVLPKFHTIAGQLGFTAGLRRRHFDVVVDFFGNPRSAILTAATGARKRIGFDFRARRYAYNERVTLSGRLRYSADHKAALVERLGVKVTDLTPQVFLSAAERDLVAQRLTELGVGPDDLFVVVCPVSRRSYKTWPAERFAHLADALIERYAAKVLLYYGPGEEDVTNAVRLHMQHNALPDFPINDLLVMAALFERAHLVVGNDGGPRHFAIAVGTPTLTVFGKDFPALWTPPDQTLHRAVEYDPGCKSDCHHPDCGEECIKDLDYRSVEAALESYLEELLRDGRPHRRGSAGTPA